MYQTARFRGLGGSAEISKDRIYKRKDDRYEGRYTVYTPDGPVRKHVYGRKYKEVQKKLAEAMGDAARGIVFDDENMTLGEYVSRWLEDSAKGDLAPRTYHNYKLQVRRHISPTVGRLKLSKLTAAHIQSLSTRPSCAMALQRFA